MPYMTTTYIIFNQMIYELFHLQKYGNKGEKDQKKRLIF